MQLLPQTIQNEMGHTQRTLRRTNSCQMGKRTRRKRQLHMAESSVPRMLHYKGLPQCTTRTRSVGDTRLRTSNFDTDAADYSWGSKFTAYNPNHITNLTTTLPPQRNLTTSTEPNHGGFTLTPTLPPQRNLTTATPQLTVGGTAVLL